MASQESILWPFVAQPLWVSYVYLNPQYSLLQNTPKMHVRLSDRPTPQNYGLLTCNILQYSFNGINDKYVLLIEVHRL